MNEQVALSPASPAQTGRPTRETAIRRQEELLERALEMFSQGGFELTTIDAIASSLNMTKRTIYARYKDKGALFEAAVKRAIDKWYIPVDVLRQADDGDLESTLNAIARIRIDNNLNPDGVRLQRIVTSEAYRFPEVYQKYEAVSQTVIRYVAELFEKYRASQPGEWFFDSQLAASAFLTIINTPARQKLLFGRVTPPAEVDRFIDGTVRLFLDGLRPR
jgi:TetR/AcrR family transcriptional regulator, mexJK operon transcriptional repressor